MFCDDFTGLKFNCCDTFVIIVNSYVRKLNIFNFFEVYCYNFSTQYFDINFNLIRFDKLYYINIVDDVVIPIIFDDFLRIKIFNCINSIDDTFKEYKSVFLFDFLKYLFNE